MNQSECDSDIHLIETLDDKQRYILLIIFSLTIVMIVIPSSFQAAIIIKTSQFKKISTYLTSNLAICDICMVIFGQIPYTMMLANKISCTSETVIYMFRSFFYCLTKLLFLLITYDRYLHIKSPYRYS